MSAPSTDEVPWWRNYPWLGRHLFRERRDRYTYDDLAQYAGQTVAWFPDGSGVRDVGPDMSTLWLRFEALGEDPFWYNYENFPPLPWDGQI